MQRLLRSVVLVVTVAASVAACAGQPSPRTVPRSPGWVEEGLASWYGPGYHGRRTASGDVYDMDRMTAAHRTLPFGTMVRVENVDNGRSVDLRINDRGPFVSGRIVDVSRAAARELGMIVPGTAPVRLVVLGDGRRGRVADAPAGGSAPSVGATDAQACAYVQVGAFADRDNGLSLAHKLEDTGAPVSTHPGDDGLLRVLLGPYDRGRAEEVRRRHRGLLRPCG